MDFCVSMPKMPRKVASWRAPTWSFAAHEGIVLYNSAWQVPSWHVPACTKLEEYFLAPKGSNPLGELKSGYARVTGLLTTIIDIEHTPRCERKACKIRCHDQSLRRASVLSDIARCDSCEALMIFPGTGLAIIPTEAKTQTYVRVGIISRIQDKDEIRTGVVISGPPLTALDWPEPSTIIKIVLNIA
ncbi:hypothetical protein BU25DRAFT_407997 [Macroventuria anomochaeta]|uniref:Uncharacterized protein n=1 Tax=Macroventuria anomochaeta TaxID=301207 RepID=A0ACB6SB28_9PLEO|nr:uncharacterized protein BU25DRAFT_407997 [Macroventuria anomochaeta]KAF2630717.1 hypothetical protein BU25DRAFT_407997 [Macroventuria anomochaeta]